MAKHKSYYLRKFHRYFGVVLGVQFLFWTLGGLYFSWNDLDKVHGDHLRSARKYLSSSISLSSPQVALQRLRAIKPVDSLHSIQLIEILGVPTYQIKYFSPAKIPAGEQGHVAGHEDTETPRVQLAHAETGALLPALTRQAAVQVARSNVIAPAEVEQVEYLTQVGGHHEYREKPLPAWAITFKDPNCTVYISAELGTFQAIRHNQWRVFDFLWMLHTMDFQGRDHIGNWLLKAFSLFGIITVLSGFVLYYVSSPSKRKKEKNAILQKV